MTDERAVPKGRWTRLGRMMWSGTRSGVSMLGRGAGAAAAAQALETLGQLRGLAAKAGQMASYVDGMLPAHQSEAYAKLLSALQTATPASPFPQVKALVEGELGGPLEQHFPSFDATPVASASIGQVHRASLPDGREVAGKVQHPGIREAFENDLSSAGALVGLASALAPRSVNSQEIYQEVADRLRDELDYRREADHQEAFRALHAHDPWVHIPEVIPSHSGTRVLTSEFVHAMNFESAVALPPERRRHFAECLWRFVFESLVVGGSFNADPHPGNYLFHTDGRVTYLDFGCTQRIPQAYQQAMRRMHLAAMEQDLETFGLALRAGAGTTPGAYETALVDYLWRCYAPLTTRPYHIHRAYVAELVRDTQDFKRHMFDRDANVTPLPPALALLNRLQFGFYSVLARFDVAVDYIAVDREILKRA